MPALEDKGGEARDGNANEAVTASDDETTDAPAGDTGTETAADSSGATESAAPDGEAADAAAESVEAENADTAEEAEASDDAADESEAGADEAENDDSTVGADAAEATEETDESEDAETPDGKADGAKAAQAARAAKAGARKVAWASPGGGIPRPKTSDGTRPEFVPHGIASRSRASSRPATAAAAARRRRRYAVLAGAAVAVVVASTVLWINRPETAVSASGTFGTAPKLQIPDESFFGKLVRREEKPSKKVESKYLMEGKGKPVAKGNFVVAGLIGYGWDGEKNRKLFSSYDKSEPMTWAAGQLSDAPALDKALIGRKSGSRVLVAIPHKDAGSQLAQGVGLKEKETLVFVADVLGSYGSTAQAEGQEVKLNDPKLPSVTAGQPGKAPTVKIPKTKAPTSLQAKTLIQGTGPAVAKGKKLVAHYQGQLWRNGKIFDSSWRPKPAMQPGAPPTPAQPAIFEIGTGKVVKGWDKGLVGQKVGSRVLLVIPPKEGYGSKGQPQGGIKGDDTLVFVVDILGAV